MEQGKFSIFIDIHMKIGYTIFIFHKTDAKRQIFPGRRASLRG